MATESAFAKMLNQIAVATAPMKEKFEPTKKKSPWSLVKGKK